MTKAFQILFLFFMLSLNSCSKDKENTTNDTEPVIYTDNYSLEIDKSYKIVKVTYSSPESRNNFSMEFIYSTDSIVQIKNISYPSGKVVMTYYLNNHNLTYIILQ